MCGGTLLASCYQFMEDPENAENVYAKHLKMSGFDNVLVLRANTPKDVLEWLVEYGDDWQDGSGFSLVEQIWQTPRVHSEWMQYAKRKGITRSTVPKGGPSRYDALYTAWLKENYPNDAFWSGGCNHYLECKEFLNCCIAQGIDEDVKQAIENTVDVLNQKVDMHAIIKNLNFLRGQIFSTRYLATWTLQYLLTVFMVNLPAYLPTANDMKVRDAAGVELPFVFQQTALDKLGPKVFGVPMGLSLVYNPKEQDKEKKEFKTEAVPNDSGDQEKGEKKGKRKAGKGGKAGQNKKSRTDEAREKRKLRKTAAKEGGGTKHGGAAAEAMQKLDSEMFHSLIKLATPIMAEEESNEEDELKRVKRARIQDNEEEASDDGDDDDDDVDDEDNEDGSDDDADSPESKVKVETERETEWLDDLMLCVQFPSQYLTDAEIKNDIIRTAFSLGCAFAYSPGKVIILPGVCAPAVWSQARAQLTKMIVGAHAALLNEVLQSGGKNLKSRDGKGLPTSGPQQQKPRVDELTQIRGDLVEDAGELSKLRKFMEDNACKSDLEFHPVRAELMKNMLDLPEGSTIAKMVAATCTTLETRGTKIIDGTTVEVPVLPMKWSRLGRLVFENTRSDSRVGELSASSIHDMEECKALMKVRPAYFRDIGKRIGSGSSRLVAEDLGNAINRLEREGVVEMTWDFDSRIRDRATLEAFWVSLFTAFLGPLPKNTADLDGLEIHKVMQVADRHSLLTRNECSKMANFQQRKAEEKILAEAVAISEKDFEEGGDGGGHVVTVKELTAQHAIQETLQKENEEKSEEKETTKIGTANLAEKEEKKDAQMALALEDEKVETPTGLEKKDTSTALETERKQTEKEEEKKEPRTVQLETEQKETGRRRKLRKQ